MNKPSSYVLALPKIKELREDAQWAAELWLRDCESLNLRFRISEVYRSQERQKRLYNQPWDGIDNDGDGKIDEANEKVTWTLTSFHTQRLAMDVVAINCSYEDLEDVANRYGIYRPPELVKLNDLGHFQFDRVKPPSVIREDLGTADLQLELFQTRNAMKFHKKNPLRLHGLERKEKRLLVKIAQQS